MGLTAHDTLKGVVDGEINRRGDCRLCLVGQERVQR